MTMAALCPYCACGPRPAGGQRHKQRQKPQVRPTGYGSATTSAPSPIRSTPASCTNREIAALPAPPIINLLPPPLTPGLMHERRDRGFAGRADDQRRARSRHRHVEQPALLLDTARLVRKAPLL